MPRGNPPVKTNDVALHGGGTKGHPVGVRLSGRGDRVRRSLRRHRGSVRFREINTLVEFRHGYRDADFWQRQKIGRGG